MLKRYHKHLLPELGRALPDGYEGDFATPQVRSQCCAVIRHRRGTTTKAPPRRCPSVRKQARNGESQYLCCQAHQAREEAARAWLAAQQAGVASGLE